MGQTVNDYAQQVDEALCSIYDVFDADNFIVQMILEYCHNHKREIAEYIKYR